MNRIEALIDVIALSHHCHAEHVGSTLVTTSIGGQRVWEGLVDVFSVVGHPQAERAYGWSYLHGGFPRFVTSLQIPPIKSAEAAVVTAIKSGQMN